MREKKWCYCPISPFFVKLVYSIRYSKFCSLSLCSVIWSENALELSIHIYTLHMLKCLPPCCTSLLLMLQINSHTFLCYAVSPTIITSLRDRAVEVGRTTSFTCLAVGIPPPIVQWLVGKLRIGEGSVLTITDVDSSMAGTYTCEASNPAASATTSAILVVFGG